MDITQQGKRRWSVVGDDSLNVYRNDSRGKMKCCR